MINKKATLREKTKKIRLLIKYILRIDKYGLLKFKNNNLSIGKRSRINAIQDISFGKNVYISTDVHISSTRYSKIILGDYVMIAHNVMLIGGDHNFEDINTPIMLQGEGKQGDIIIEDDVWIGAGSIILTGTKIGKGSIVGGNPAKLIKKRK